MAVVNNGGTPTFTRSGQNLDAGTDTRELFLKVFSGEVLATYRRMNKIRDRVRRRVLTSGKVAQFPAIGKAAANYHTPGQSLLTETGLLSSVEHGEQLIYIDKKLISGSFVDELDQMLQHFQNRGEIAEQLGIALATQDDTQLLRVVAQAARATSGATADHPIGKAIWDASMSSNLDNFIQGVRAAGQIMDENDVPEDGRVLCVKPYIYRRLVEEKSALIDKDFTEGNGGTDSGIIRRLFGFEIIKTNNLPQTDNTGSDPNAYSGAPAGNFNDYSNNMTGTVALLFHMSAIGSASLMGVKTSATWFEEYQGWMLLAKQAVGHGVLRPGAAVELNTASTGLTNAATLASYA